MIVAKSQAKFEDVKEDVVNAVTKRGLVVDYTAHIGAMLDRTKFIGYILFAIVFTGFIYPTVAHWTWGGGWLLQDGFQDFAGSSISVFPHLGGFEDVFDAVWVNVGDRIRWGSPYRLRVVCDGEALLVYAGADQVLYRAFADVVPSHPHLAVRRVGLAVNWEWGTDTGTVFGDVHARRR